MLSRTRFLQEYSHDIGGVSIPEGNHKNHKLQWQYNNRHLVFPGKLKIFLCLQVDVNIHFHIADNFRNGAWNDHFCKGMKLVSAECIDKF